MGKCLWWDPIRVQYCLPGLSSLPVSALGCFPKDYDLELRSNRDACACYSGEESSSTECTQITWVLDLMILMSERFKFLFLFYSPPELIVIGLITSYMYVGMVLDGAAIDTCK